MSNFDFTLSKEPRPLVISIALFIAILAVSTASLFIRFAQSEVPSLVIAAYRLSLAAVFTAFFIRRKELHEIQALDRKKWKLIVFSGLLLGVHFAFWISSLKMTSVTSSVVLVTTTPIWVVLFSPILLKEKNNWKTGLGLAIAFIGSIIVIFNIVCLLSSQGVSCSLEKIFSEKNILAGNLFALVAAFAAAGYTMIGRKVRSFMSILPYTLVVYSIAAIELIIFSLIAGEHFGGYSIQSVFWLILLALIPQIIGHSTLNWTLGFLPASSVSIALLGEPVGSSLLAWVFLAEAPTCLELIGGMIVLLGVLFAIRSTYKVA